MKFARILKEVLWCLFTESKVSYRRIKQDFGLDDEGLEELRSLLIKIKRCARDQDGQFLVWAPEPHPAAPVSTEGDWAARTPVADAGKQALSLTTDASPKPAGPPTTLDLPGAERRLVTVLFCDLVGSTDLSARLDPEDLADVIRAYHDAVSRVIRRFDGFLAKYMGDGVLAYFGYPHAQEKDAERAVRTGLAILEAMPVLNAAVGQANEVALAVHIAIATGLVMVGETIGEGATVEKSVVGETPNLAARLQSLAGPDGIVVAALTREIAGNTFIYQDLGAHALKGIAEPIQAFAVLGLCEGDWQAEAAARPTRLVGRDEEIGLLRRAWQQTRDERRGQVVLVNGEPGIGKSVLVQTLRAEVQARGLPRITFRCSPYHTNSVLHPVIEHLKRVVDWHPEDNVAIRLEKLERFLGVYSLGHEAVPLIATLLSIPCPPDRYPPLSLAPQQLKQQTEDVLVALTLQEAERRPVLEVWEDLHWADPSTLELLGLLIEQAPTSSLLMVLTFRPEFTPPWPARSHLMPITLNRLERTQIEVLAVQLAGSKALPGEVVEYIVRRTDGVPLYVEELTKTVVGSGLLREQAGRYVQIRPLSELAIPASLQGVLMARLDRLPSGREVAQLGAVLGREFAYEMLLTIAAIEEAKLRDGLLQLVGAELLYQRGRLPRASYFFKHALIQEAAYQSLLKRTRQQYHRQIALLLESRFPETRDSQPELVAHHYTEAGDIGAAIVYWHKAGQKAAAGSANREAAGHVAKALNLLRGLPDTPQRTNHELALQRLLGKALMATSGFSAPETVAAFSRARELTRTTTNDEGVYPMLWGVWTSAIYRADHALAREVAEEIGARSQGGDDSEPRITGHIARGFNELVGGAISSALDHYEQAICLYQVLPSVKSLIDRYPIELGAIAYSYAGWCHWLLGHPDQALQWISHVQGILDRTQHAFTTSRALYWKAVLHQFRGEWAAAHSQAELLIGLGEEHGYAMGVAVGRILRGAARAALKDGVFGAREMREGLEAYSATGARLQRPHYLALLAEALWSQGLAKEGLAVVAEATLLIEESGERYYEAEIRRLEGALRLALGGADMNEVEALYRRALDIARSQQALSLALRAAFDLGQLWAQCGKRQQAHELLLQVYQGFTEGFDTADLLKAKRLLDELC